MSKRTIVKPGACRKIGILGYDGVQALDVIGPADAFAFANEVADQELYQVLIVGFTRKFFTAESGVSFRPHTTLEAVHDLDTFIVPGGVGIRKHPGNTRKLGAWLLARRSGIRRVASVCTGIYGLAACGILNGQTVTTHWRFTRDLAEKFPQLSVDGNAIFIKSGGCYTSAGVTAGIDLSLALIEEDCGADIALAVAREMVVYLKRPGGQEQFSESLKFQVTSTDALATLLPWLKNHLAGDLSVEALAARVHLSSRQFSRKFKTATGLSPAEFVENLRLDEARSRLSRSNASIKALSASVGFASSDTFRRAFERRFGIAPTMYRGRFDKAARSRT